MLRFRQSRSVTLSPAVGFREKLKRWWMVMTDEEQRDIILRSATVVACAAAVSVSLPMIGQTHADKRADADMRDQASRLAMYEDGGATARASDHAASVLDSPWLRTVEYSLERDTDASMSRYAMRDRDGAALSSLISFRSDHIKRAENTGAEHMCLAQAVYYESGNEPLSGKLAVAEVIANRMRDHRYPDTICGVVYQGATRTTGCQFTFTCDGALKRKPIGNNWENAKKVAAHVLMNLNEERTGGATHYHATYVDPIWNAGLIRTDKIGLHIFYRFPRGAEWQTVRQDWGTRRAKAKTSTAKRIVAATDTVTPSLNAVSYKGDTATSEYAVLQVAKAQGKKSAAALP
jgi:spore germination cell wall hydrolase CwlJ-like protein